MVSARESRQAQTCRTYWKVRRNGEIDRVVIYNLTSMSPGHERTRANTPDASELWRDGGGISKTTRVCESLTVVYSMLNRERMGGLNSAPCVYGTIGCRWS